jgi:hypothetical protein
MVYTRSFSQGALAAAVVLAWMAIGWGFQLDVNTYLLLGVPIVVVYQGILQRKPLRALWQFDGSALTWGRTGVIASICAAALPATILAAQLLLQPRADIDTAVVLWVLCATAGASGLGWSIAAWRRSGWRFDRRQTALMAAAVACGVLVFSMNGMRSGQHLVRSIPTAAGSFFTEALLLGDACFVIEEVVFRGAFDPAIGGGLTTGRGAIGSAAWVSVLWGLWHLPMVVHGRADWPAALQVLAFHLAIGIPMSMLARRAGTLGPTVAVHAVIDAYRDLWMTG